MKAAGFKAISAESMDDNFLLAPSLHLLQCLLDTCEEYAENNIPRFRKDPDPIKYKYKRM